MISKSRNIGNKTFNIYGNENDKDVFNNILSNSDYENHMINFYKIILKEDSVCFDVGANIGIISMYLSLYTKEKIYAFEPIEENFLLLNKKIT